MSAGSRFHGTSTGLLLVGLLAFSTPCMAQRPDTPGTPSVAGRWSATWAQAVRIHRGDSVEVQKWGDAVLVLEQEGRDVHGTWTTSVKGTVRWRVTGTVGARGLTLRATENDSSDPELAQLQELQWRATLIGDRMEGTMTLVFRGVERSRPWRPWRATRDEPG